MPSVQIKMTPQKRKADANSPAEPSAQSPPKRARSGSPGNTAKKQDDDTRCSIEPLDHTDPSIPTTKRSISPAPIGSETGSLGDLPETWDQASAADKLLVQIKERNTKIQWSSIEKEWIQSTGVKPAKGVVQDRYRRLKDIRARSGAGGALGRTVRSKAVKPRLRTPNGSSTVPTTRRKSSSREASEPPEESLDSFAKFPMETSAKSTNAANSGPSDNPSLAISNGSGSAAPDELASQQDIPHSWEEANDGDRLIMRMKGNQKGWATIEPAWEKLTGEKPENGALLDRYKRMKDFVIWPGPTRGKNKASSVGSKTVDGASGPVVRRHTKPAPRKRKAEREPSDEPLDKSSNESSNESSGASSSESSDEISKHSTTVARRKPGGATGQRMKAGASDESSSRRMSARKKILAQQPNDGDSDLEPSQESNETPKNSSIVAKSAKRSRVMPVAAKDSEEQNTAENANEMLADMREKGHSWLEISKAWTERTGVTCHPETLRQRFLRSKKGSTTEPKSTIRPTIKRKVQVTSPTVGSYDSSAKRRKSTAENSSITETPVKRNMDRGKRKSSVKYTDSTTDEDELFAAPTKPATAATPVKRNAGRSAKVDRSDPEWLVTNEKSPLADEDLHAEFSDPKTYENFTKSDWEDLRETLPTNVPCNPDGYSIPMTFFKYDPDFRRGIREFQEDLGSGRLDPEWQADAALAMEERARGDFDSYKENEFEAFWGQKQKLRHDALAGESTKIKLELLIQQGLFKVGDSFNYSRMFGRGKNGVLVEKACKVSEVFWIVLVCRRLWLTVSQIVEINDKALMFAIPPGQRKYSRQIYQSIASRDNEPEVRATIADIDGQLPNNLESETHGAEAGTAVETDGNEGPAASQKGDGVSVVIETAQNGHCPEIGSTDPESVSNNKTAKDRNEEPEQEEGLEVEASAESQKDETPEVTTSQRKRANGVTVQTNGDQTSSAGRSGTEDTLYEISNLTQLEHKLVDIDGRFQSKEISVQNTWKTFRCSRSNQDMGTLFEIREEFYVYKHPRIVKEAKRKR